MIDPHPMIAILGPTASGKTKYAVMLARAIDGEILSADSRQLYRKMDIGTGKDLQEYEKHGSKVPYHLIDILPAGARGNLHSYLKAFWSAYLDIVKRDKIPILCGGSGLYAEAILRNYNLVKVDPDPDLRAELSTFDTSALIARLRAYGPLHNETDIESRARLIRAIEIAEHSKQANLEKTKPHPKIESLVFALDIPRDIRRSRISDRLKSRLAQGLIEEVEALLKDGVAEETLLYYGLEYRFVTEYLLKKVGRQEMEERLEIAIHQFAKRQMTYLRGMERRGVRLIWIDATRSQEYILDEMIGYIQKTSF